MIAGALAAASIAFAATTSFAAPRYDGLWSVAIVTHQGDCIASYRYPMRIAHGILANGGDMAIGVSGRVAANGSVTVVVSQRRHPRCRIRPARGQRRRGFWRGFLANRVLRRFVDRRAARPVRQLP